ncbi:E-beta-farnesene synthase 1 [Tanacetum coccineum]
MPSEAVEQEMDANVPDEIDEVANPNVNVLVDKGRPLKRKRVSIECKCGLPLMTFTTWTRDNPARRFGVCPNKYLENKWYITQLYEMHLLLNPSQREELENELTSLEELAVLQVEFADMKGQMQQLMEELKKNEWILDLEDEEDEDLMDLGISISNSVTELKASWPRKIFKSYMGEDGTFKKSLCNDAQGTLALYEAAYMRVEGEQVLDEALEFTKIILDVIANDPSCDSSLRTQIQQALKQPLRRRLARLEALRYIPIYQHETSRKQVLLKLAKLDFNMLQSMHKMELSQICKWWKDLDMQNKLPYVRDRVIEGYLWILSIYYEPQYSQTRIFLMKTCMWLVVLDDTFDNYGTYEELEIFTQAVERWSISCLDMLPEMKLIYQELVNSHLEMEKLLEKEGKQYQIHYVKEMDMIQAKKVVRNYLVEAKWLKEGYIPTLEEYMSVSMVTSTYGLMIARSYVGRGDIVTEDSFKWVSRYPPIVKASCVILRLMDDIEEQERGHIASSIECYAKESGASEEEACVFISKKVEDAWKVINKESLKPTDVPFSLVMPAINLARMCEVLYNVNDGFTHAGEEMINYIKLLFLHPIPV